MINRMIDEQTLNDLQALMKNMIRFELEDMIYSCLNKGYATPAEDKRIRITSEMCIWFDSFDL